MSVAIIKNQSVEFSELSMLVYSSFCVFSFIIPLLLTVAFLTLAERKVLAAMQRRRGPNIVGFLGLMQPFADALKLLFKETIIPSNASKFLFIFSPIFTLLIGLMSWAVVPFSDGVVFANLAFGVLYLFATSSLGVYGVFVAGWASNSRYALLGALRSAAQMISYEVSLGLILISLIACTHSLNLTEIVLFQRYIWFIIPFWPLFLMFFISIVAETNRTPFDLPEAEGELVSGYNVEYSAAGFALFFVAEYTNIVLMSSLCVIFFCGGWLPVGSFLTESFYFWFSVKLIFFLFTFIWIRASFPRYRYDQLMCLGWKVFLPLALAWCISSSSIIFLFFKFFYILMVVTLNVNTFIIGSKRRPLKLILQKMAKSHYGNALICKISLSGFDSHLSLVQNLFF